jgi:4-diphosphocytidyl-2-C-methyl-D-erythritol kinase
MRGIGERVGAALGLPPLPSVLVNPRLPVPTPRVFAALGLERGAPAPFGAAVAISPGPGLGAALKTARNDLQPAAIAIEPTVAEVLTRLEALEGVECARMSGSGATCFGLFSSATATRAAAKVLRAKYRHWWVRAGVLGG